MDVVRNLPRILISQKSIVLIRKSGIVPCVYVMRYYIQNFEADGEAVVERFVVDVPSRNLKFV